jgi:serine/threonine protein kinase/tetratricopeptide (TPR) repeat protein
MTPEEWQEVKNVLQTALELDLTTRLKFLDSACAGKSGLRAEVDSLLQSHDEDEIFLYQPVGVAAVDGAVTRVGRRVGPYQLLDAIGEGGMGEVYRAVRVDGMYDKQVAIKLIHGGLSTEFFISRFRNERQILANLEHPNIARLLDGGVTPEGLPYVVLEYVPGMPIDEYCAIHKLGIATRLILFREVCSAVQYAHQNLIVHRDLKPGNILVTTDGIPKLLDFGVAKMLDTAGEAQDRTLTLMRIMTPDFASPEQVRGDPITTSSDIYALGVILYLLLTGQRPYRVSNTAAPEIIKAICETAPEKPSTAAARGAKQKPTPKSDEGEGAFRESGLPLGQVKIRRALNGDLDNIVLKALRKEPERRYATVEQFSEDVRRHLEHLPVIARKDTAGYRTWKFVQRHKGGVAASVCIAMLLIGALAVTIHEARIASAQQARAERRFNDVRELANSLMFEVHDSIQDLPGATPARKLLVSKALKYLDSLSQEAASDAPLQRELAAAYEKLGNVQGNPFQSNLGDTAGALASYRKALAIRESLGTDSSGESRRNLANDYEWIGMALDGSGDYRSAIPYFLKDVGIREALARATPNAQSEDKLASAYFLMAYCYAGLQDPKGALENYRKSAAIREQIADSSPSVLSRLAGNYGYMAGILWHLGERGQALTLERKSLEILKKLYDADPTNAVRKEFLAEGYYWTGFYQEGEKELTQALLNYRHALDHFQSLAKADPTEVRVKEYVARCHQSVGTALVSRGDLSVGLQSIRKGLSIFKELPAPENEEDVADANAALGLAYSRLATQSGNSQVSKAAYWRQSRAAYQESLDQWFQVKNRGALTMFTTGEPDRVGSELANCDAAISRLAGQIH